MDPGRLSSLALGVTIQTTAVLELALKPVVRHAFTHSACALDPPRERLFIAAR
jgi:hypothetical protein